MNDLVLKNCKLIESLENHNIGIDNGKISEISRQPLKADAEVDINGKIILPGLIDPHVHFRDPGLTYKESFKTGSFAAAHGGFTTILDMPNTIPPTNTVKEFKKKKKIGENKSIINFGLHSGLNNLNEIKKIANLNPASFKIFMDLYDDFEIKKMFEDISTVNKTKKIPITLHCENRANIEENTKRIKNLECTRGSTAIDYSYARNSESEYLSVKYAVDLAQKYGLSIHICHLSAKKSLEYLKSLKLKSMNNSNIEITTEITPHHLLLDNSSFDRFGTLVKTNPPLREKGENLTIKSLIDINMIGTDHAPHRIDEKQMGVWDSSPGIPNLETVLPLLLTEVNRGNIDLKMIPKLMSETPAKRFGIENKGKIEVGYDADLVIIDLKEEGKFNIDNFYTKAKYSPFENFNYKGIATMTICNGKIIMNKDNIEYGYNGSNSITNSNSNIYLESDNRVKYVYD